MALARSPTSFVPQLARDGVHWVLSRINKRHFLAIITVMFLWAICYPLIVLGLSEAPHLSFATLRAVLAGAALLLIAYSIGVAPPHAQRLACLGLFGRDWTWRYDARLHRYVSCGRVRLAGFGHGDLEYPTDYGGCARSFLSE